MGYAESLFAMEGGGNAKQDRNQVAGKRWLGASDRIIADGGANRVYRPLWFRTYRYLQLEIETADEPLTLVDLRAEATGYPFAERAIFDAADAELKKIWDIGWRTLKLCAVDNFYDCPYYERLQYAGDTRIEALVSVYVSGDGRLMRKAIDLLNDSRKGGELTASRYPSSLKQIIPPFCNWWIAMVDDYRLLNGDRAFIREMAPTIDSIIERFDRHTDPATGLITFSADGEWDFVDWSGNLSHSQKRNSDERSPSGLLTLNHIYALDRAVNIMEFLGDRAKAEACRERGRRLRQAVMAQCWDEEKGILADSPKTDQYSEHANILGILTDTIPIERQKEVMEKILAGNSGMTKVTLYFHFYLNRALVKTGLADRYLETLTPWRDQIELNLTTWAETPEPARSDCHAWGSSPNYEFLATIAGITPASAGFETVRIAPALGKLATVDARMPHSKGMIEVRLQRRGTTGLTASVTLPEGLTGDFEWNGRRESLESGEQALQFD
jgi:hypothetical protein